MMIASIAATISDLPVNAGHKPAHSSVEKSQMISVMPPGTLVEHVESMESWYCCLGGYHCRAFVTSTRPNEHRPGGICMGGWVFSSSCIHRDIFEYVRQISGSNIIKLFRLNRDQFIRQHAFEQLESL